ncbi:MAG: hypothetical protein PHP88_02360 [bacterium]|nr:hypothetical protein [bacterium]
MKRTFTLLILTGGVLLWLVHASAAGRGVLWTRLFDGGAAERDRAYTVSISGDNVVAAGFEREPDTSGTNAFVEKAVVRSFTRDGALNWSLTRGGDQSEYWDSAVDGAGNVYLVGTQFPISGDPNSFLLTKLTPSGTLAWENAPMASGYTAVGTSICPPRVSIKDGILYMMGSVRGHSTDNDAIFVEARNADNGTLLWSTALTGPAGLGFDSGTGLASGDDGSGGTVLVLAGWARNVSGGTDFYVARLNPADGSPSLPGWERVVTGAGTHSRTGAVAATPTRIFVTGIMEDPGAPGNFSAAVVAFDLTGNEIWRDSSVAGSVPSDSNNLKFIETSGGTLFVAGTLDNGTLDTYARAYRGGDGVSLWRRDIAATAYAGGPKFLALSGSFVVLGGVFPDGPVDYKPGIIFLDNATGVVADNVVFTQSTSSDDAFADGVAGAGGVVFAVGRMNNPQPGGTQDFFVGATDPPPPSASSGGGGGGWCSAAPVSRQSAPPAWEWGLPFAPALILAARRRIRKAFSCNKGVNP